MIVKQQKIIYISQLNTAIKVTQRNQQNKRISVKRNIIEGFKCLNQNNIVHRDLKPENILLHDKTVKIADFGFSKVVESGMDEPILYSFVGTPLYMSPQILQKQNYSSKTDIWSLGMIFYELIYSRRAWDGKGYFDLLENILKKPLQFPPLPKVHQQTKNIINRMLQLKEEERINWEELFQFFSIENLRLIYSDFLGNVNTQSKELQNLQLHQLYDQNSNSRSGQPSSPTSTFSMKSERIDEEEKNGNGHLKLNSEGNINKMDEENQNGNNLQQSNQSIRSQDTKDDELMNESQMNTLLEHFTQNINIAQQFQLVLQLQQLLNKKRGQKLTINEVKQMVMNQLKPQSQNGNQQINQQQGTFMRGGLFHPNNLMNSNKFNLQQNSQVQLQQQESIEMSDNSSGQNSQNGNGVHQVNGNGNGNNHMNGNGNNNHMNGNGNGNGNGNHIKQTSFVQNGYNNINQQSNVDEID